MVLEKTLESPLDCKEIKPDSPKGNQPWIYNARTDAEVEAPIFGHLMPRADSLEKPWCWERLKVGKGTIEDEMVEWHYHIGGHEFK